jgi:hypothetical protein
MRLYRYKSYKLSATVTPCKDGFWIEGTFGLFGFESSGIFCEDCRQYVPDSGFIWCIKRKKGSRAQHNAILAIEERLKQIEQPPTGKEQQINL